MNLSQNAFIPSVYQKDWLTLDKNFPSSSITTVSIAHVNKYPTMHYFANSRHTQSMMAYMISANFSEKLHCGNVLTCPIDVVPLSKKKLLTLSLCVSSCIWYLGLKFEEKFQAFSENWTVNFLRWNFRWRTEFPICPIKPSKTSSPHIAFSLTHCNGQIFIS